MPLGEPVTMDPAVARETLSHFFVSNVFGGLVRPCPEFDVMPDLAERWTLDDAGTAYTLVLSEGLTFHCGRLLGAVR